MTLWLKQTFLACSLLATQALTANAEIKIGVPVPLSGIYASLGGQIVTGVKFAAQEINEAGGIKGEKIVIEPIDDKCAVDNATAVANQLIGKGIIAVIGHLCDRPSIEAARIYAENKVIQLSPTSQNPAFTENRPLSTGGTYRLAARNSQQAEVLSAFIKTRASNTKISIVNDGSVYGKGLADTISESLKEAGITPVFETDFESGEERYRTLSARIVDSGAGLVFIGSIHLDAATLIRDIDRLTQNITFVGGDGFVHADFFKLVLEDNPNREGMTNIFSSFPKDPRKLPTASATVERFIAAEFNPAGLALRGYAAMQIIESTLRQASKPEFPSLVEILNSKQFQTPIGLISFDKKGDANLKDYHVHQWQGKTIVPVN